MKDLAAVSKSLVKSRAPFLVAPLLRARSLARAARPRAQRVMARLPMAKTLRGVALDRKRRVVFNQIFLDNTWGDPESRSGQGSNLYFTETVRAELPALIAEFSVTSMLDIPCGDFNWMRLLQLDLEYIGGDIVGPLVDRNQKAFGNERRRFAQLDIVRDRLPKVDLVFCRDCLVHLSYEDALAAIDNIKRSGSTYLLTTTYVDRKSNRDILTGDWRTLNLRLPPFAFPAPVTLLDERAPQEGFADKGLGLWRIADLPEFGH